MLTANKIKEMLLQIADMYIEKEDELSKYDAVIGDGDHGITMARGAKAAKIKVSELENGTCRDLFKVYGRTLVAELGGAMGPLFGSIFLELSKACIDKDGFDAEELVLGIKNAEIKICDLGGAKVEDKTMVDAINPTVKSLLESQENTLNLLDTLKQAEQAAKKGVESTIPLPAKKGRSRYLQEKSIGHQDAGATSFYYLISTMRSYVEQNNK